MKDDDEEIKEEISIGNIREVSFSNLNYAVVVKSSYENDSLEKLKKAAFDVLKVIQNEEITNS